MLASEEFRRKNSRLAATESWGVPGEYGFRQPQVAATCVTPKPVAALPILIRINALLPAMRDKGA